MVGTPRDYGMVQLSVTVYPQHVGLIEKIQRGEYRKPLAHKSVSEIVRRAIEYYAMYLGIKGEGDD